jgi:outer membrane protein insertion porin family
LLDDKETSAGLTIYDMTNEYADYDHDGDEIARYDKQRRGQELTFSRRTNNEYVVNYLTLKNREDIYKGVADGTKMPPIF